VNQLQRLNKSMKTIIEKSAMLSVRCTLGDRVAAKENNQVVKSKWNYEIKFC